MICLHCRNLVSQQCYVAIYLHPAMEISCETFFQAVFKMERACRFCMACVMYIGVGPIRTSPPQFNLHVCIASYKIIILLEIVYKYSQRCVTIGSCSEPHGSSTGLGMYIQYGFTYDN